MMHEKITFYFCMKPFRWYFHLFWHDKDQRVELSDEKNPNLKLSRSQFFVIWVLAGKGDQDAHKKGQSARGLSLPSALVDAYKVLSRTEEILQQF